MSGTFIKVSEKPSKFGGKYFEAYFKMDDGHSARTCLDPKKGNFQKWAPFVERVKKGEGVHLTGIVFIGNRFVNADSSIREEKVAA